jgi:hypothetical protein
LLENEQGQKLGERVYLNWSKIAPSAAQHLSQYRLTPGVIEHFRGGQGVRKTVGVRFNADPELTWLAPDETSRIPVTEG